MTDEKDKSVETRQEIVIVKEEVTLAEISLATWLWINYAVIVIMYVPTSEIDDDTILNVCPGML